jgi:hypothetical protein
MAIQYLIDENMPSLYREQLLRHLPNLIIHTVGDLGVPPRGTLDPEIIVWCEKNGFLLITKNRRSMPFHLADHLSTGHHLPGILVLRRQADVGQVIADLVLIAEAADDDEYLDRISYVPLA